MYYPILAAFWMLFCNCGGSGESPDILPPVEPVLELTVAPASLTLPAESGTANVKVTANAQWEVTADQGWFAVSPAAGHAGETSLKLTAQSNFTGNPRTGLLTFSSGEETQTYTFTQEGAEEKNYVPQGYSLVWKDEFDASRGSDGKPAMPSATEWWFETGGHGWGNNELQTYVDRTHGTDTCAVVTDGTLKIIARKKGNQVISIRMNTKESWTYGYFEARLKLPQGRGTWPAFWMMPQNFVAWPDDGEIDIMEEVGYRPNWVSSAIHCKAYYHSINTQKTGEQYVATAETDFHVYAVEWTEEYIEGFVDGKPHFKFLNDKQGNKDTWPFDQPFYLKLNLAWGGDWGGSQGVDETKLPAVYEIDYVRVYQKK